MKLSQGHTIESVVKDGLCTGCGTCAGLCPTEAIEMVADKRKGNYLPKLDKERCIDCGICYQVCPGRQIDFKRLNLKIFGKEPEDILIGNYLNCYIGHSTDYDIRYNSASGGLITQLLIFASEEGIIDGALVTRMKRDSPLEPEPFIARTKEEITEASKSKYCPVSANISLKKILKSERGGRFAIVGLPCHIHGIRKTEEINKGLKEKIALHLGIFCSHTPNFWGTELLLRNLHVRNDEVVKLDYRGEGWPGYMRVSQKGRETLLLLPDYWNFLGSDFFIPARCLMCGDQTSELADISFGDAWLPGLSDEIGSSIIVSRTRFGEQFLRKAMAKNLIQLDQVTANEVKCSQVTALYFKKKSLQARLKLFRKKPFLNVTLLESDFMDHLLSLFPYLNRLVSQNQALRLLLEHTPRRLLFLYNLPVNLIRSRKVRSFEHGLLKPTLKNKLPNVIVTSHGSKFNKGNMALLKSRVSTLRQLIPEAKFTVFTLHPEIENELRDVKTLEVIGRVPLSRKMLLAKKTWQTMLRLVKCSLWWVLRRFFHLDLKRLTSEEGLNEYYNADLIISTGGDVLTEDYGTFSFLTHVVNFLFALLLNKPVALYAESIGPFRHWWNRIIAKFLLNRVKLITLREEISQKYLDELRIKTPVCVTADSAFLLKPAPVQNIKEILEKEGLDKNNRPLMGISVSKIISHYGFDDLNTANAKYHRYIELMVQLTDYLTQDLNAKVIFIPHVIEPWGHDDRTGVNP